ncbi:unnamed protein product [Porites evermanni]|uniref:Uncharacterized protein n=1 Tax=Porites evermanni TaxID=104178 RepID=A0ABN8QNP8_9CNID|nr:unnamed protein product [Porites evermanni]
MLACWKWSEHTLFLLWLVLHHNLFSFQTVPKDYENFTCVFHAYVHYIKEEIEARKIDVTGLMGINNN